MKYFVYKGLTYALFFPVGCNKNEIQCVGGDKTKASCFTLEQRCDGNNQCSSGYDELNCGRYCLLMFKG